MVVNVLNQTESARSVTSSQSAAIGSGEGKLQTAGRITPLKESTISPGAISEGQKIENIQEELQKAIDEANKSLEFKNISLAYSVDETTEDIVVKIIDKSNDKLIRQIPPESVLKFRGRMKEFLGEIFDENG